MKASLTTASKGDAAPQQGTEPAPAGLRRGAILRKIATLFSGTAAAQGITAITLLLTARQLGLERYGQYTLCFALAGMTSVLFNLGSDNLLLRDGGRQPSRLGLLTGSTLAMKIFLGGIWLALFFFLGTRLNQEDYPAGLLLISASSVLMDHLLQTLITSFNAALSARTASLLDAGSKIVWLSGTLLLIRSESVDPYAFARVRLAAAVLVGALGVWRVWRTAGLKVSTSIIGTILRQAPPFAISDALSLASMRQDLLIIGFVLGDAAAGLYSPAVNLVNALFLVPVSVYSVMVPILGRLYTSDVRQAALSARRMILMLLAIGAGLSVAFYLGAPVALVLLGKSYTGVTELLRILSLVLLFKCGSFAMAAIIIVTGQQPRRTLFQFVSVLVNAILNLLVVSRWGVTGVAGVYVFTEMVLFLGYGWIVARRSRFSEGSGPSLA